MNSTTDTKNEHQNKYSILINDDYWSWFKFGIHKCTYVHVLREILLDSLTHDKPVPVHSIPACSACKLVYFIETLF